MWSFIHWLVNDEWRQSTHGILSSNEKECRHSGAALVKIHCVKTPARHVHAAWFTQDFRVGGPRDWSLGRLARSSGCLTGKSWWRWLQYFANILKCLNSICLFCVRECVYTMVWISGQRMVVVSLLTCRSQGLSLGQGQAWWQLSLPTEPSHQWIWFKNSYRVTQLQRANFMSSSF